MLPFAAHALQSEPVTTAHGTATLVSDADSIAPGQKLRIGLQLHIQRGWHTYWANPGDAGAPPTLDITGAKAGPIDYPTPQREQDGPFTSYIYTDDVLLPLTVTTAAGGTHLQAHATWLVCEKLCVPEDASFTLDIPAGTGAPGPQAKLFAAASAASPRPNPFPAHISTDGTLRIDGEGLTPLDAYFFPADSGIIDQDVPQTFTADAHGLSLHLKPLHPFKGLAGVLTMTDRSGRNEALSIDASPGADVQAATLPGVARALLLAFAGGLILNLMPCVLPVLAMKALALARLGGQARSAVRAEAGLYTLGVLTAFAAIGGVTLAATAAGGSGGWGVQFQSAAFTGAMAWLLLAIGLNFSGMFEIGLSLTGVGQGFAGRNSFFTGLLAVVLATPCTAPFMATALAAAIVLPPVEGMAIFLALGAGLAAPYALLAAIPGLARFLPRPGAWMVRLRQILALPMYGFAAWLAWVLWHQAGTIGLAALVLGGICVTLGAVLWGRYQRGSAGRFPALGAVLAASLILAGLAARAPHAAPMTLAPGAEPFSPARLAALRAAHRPVLVDMSAAWCITCLVNERLALAPAAVRDAFARKNVAYLVGDWTRQDADITAFLHQFGRNGVPLYVYYPADGSPEVLPQILTEAEVLGRLGA
jgi:thiol:disulfide interchange protein/DsbC/DsbD-like thiol-disulfide interchange protein